MPESPKLTRLRSIRQKLAAGQLSEQDRKIGVIFDTDGAETRLSDPDALASVDRRIAAEAGAA